VSTPKRIVRGEAEAISQAQTAGRVVSYLQRHRSEMLVQFQQAAPCAAFDQWQVADLQI
jgi:hypothetical protein